MEHREQAPSMERDRTKQPTDFAEKQTESETGDRRRKRKQNCRQREDTLKIVCEREKGGGNKTVARQFIAKSPMKNLLNYYSCTYFYFY